MLKFKINWGWVFWISISLLFIWLIAKELGYINTPEYIRIIPYITSFFALLGSIMKFGEYAHKFNNVVDDLSIVKSDIKEIKLEINSLDKRIGVMGESIKGLDKRVSIIESRI